MFEFDLKTILWIITIIIGIYWYYDYIVDTLNKKTTPHLFSWIVFVIMDTIAFLIQIWDNAWPWAWWTLITGVMAFFIVILALRNWEKNITNSDKVAFSLALFSIFLYVFLENQLYSLLVVLSILVFAMYPTFRKTYNKPNEETLSLYFLAGVRSIISIIATVNISILTVWLPVFVILINALFIWMVFIRRKQLKIDAF